MTTVPAVLPRLSDKSFYAFNAALSAAALAFLAWILLLRGGQHDPSALSFMPAVNASLNAVSATLIVAGLVAIKRRKPDTHKYLMVSAFFSSTLFLVGYLVYHYVHGDTRYPGTGPMRTVYFTILVSHIVLSAVALPLTLTSFFFAFRRSFERHKKVVKVTLPLWLYVSVTGVAIYFFLRGA
jgi:putative membrane protein